MASGITHPAVYAWYETSIRTARTFRTLGIGQITADDYLATPPGKVYLAELAKADPGASIEQLYVRAIDQLTTGTTVPRLRKTSSPVVKIVPKGERASDFSPFFTSIHAIQSAARSKHNLADCFGLPLIREASIYSIYEISPRATAIVFENLVAPTLELGFVKHCGGALQYLVPNRTVWTSAIHIGSIINQGRQNGSA